MIYSLKVEKHLLAGLIRFPDVYAEIAVFVKESDFFEKTHKTIFSVIKHCFDKKERWDKVLLAEKIKNLGVGACHDINIYDYIDTLSYVPITEGATVDAAKELKKITVRREFYEIGEKLQKHAKSCGNEPYDKIVAESDSIYADTVQQYEISDRPVALFSKIADAIEERGNNPLKDLGIQVPYEAFNRAYGGLRDGNIYAIASRPGQGKSTIINDLCYKTSLDKKIPVLICDTEMFSQDIQFRLVASQSGVPFWHAETGQWRRHPEMVEKMRAALQSIGRNDNYFHYHVGNKSIDQVVSMIRRWHYTHVGRGNKCIIAYDYLKLTGENISKQWAEYQVMGEKVDKLKRLSEDLMCPVVTAIQLNRTGENQSRQGASVVDDSSAIAVSDRLQWFASFVAIFRRKTTDEIAHDGNNFGTHKLIPVKTRFQGEQAAGHQDLVRRLSVDGKRHQFHINYLNFNVDNFNVEERGTLRDIVEQSNQQHQPVDENVRDSNTVL